MAVLLFAGAALLAHHNGLGRLETDIFRLIYNKPAFLEPLFRLIALAGSIYCLLVLTIVCFLIKQHQTATRLLVSGWLAYILASLAKSAVGRPRPVEFLNIIVHDSNVHGAGFPSGHTALAAAIGLTLALHLPRKYRWA